MRRPGKNVVKNRVCIIFGKMSKVCCFLHFFSRRFKRQTVMKAGHTIEIHPLTAVFHYINQGYKFFVTQACGIVNKPSEAVTVRDLTFHFRVWFEFIILHIIPHRRVRNQVFKGRPAVTSFVRNNGIHQQLSQRPIKSLRRALAYSVMATRTSAYSLSPVRFPSTNRCF